MHAGVRCVTGIVILSRDKITTVVIPSCDRITTIVIMSRSYSITLHRFYFALSSRYCFYLYVSVFMHKSTTKLNAKNVLQRF